MGRSQRRAGVSGPTRSVMSLSMPSGHRLQYNQVIAKEDTSQQGRVKPQHLSSFSARCWARSSLRVLCCVFPSSVSLDYPAPEPGYAACPAHLWRVQGSKSQASFTWKSDSVETAATRLAARPEEVLQSDRQVPERCLRMFLRDALRQPCQYRCNF